MDKTIDRWTDPDGNGYAFKDTVARAQNRATIDKMNAETADRKSELDIERKRIDNLIKELPATAGEYKQSKLVLHSYGNTAVKCTTTSRNYTNVPAFTTDQGGALSSLYTKKSNYQIAVNKAGLYLFELRAHVNSLTANKRVELAPFVNDERNAALASSYNTAGSFTLTKIVTLSIWLNANDTIDFRIAPIDAAEVSVELGDVLVYAIDWDDKFKIPDYTGYANETKDLRVGADGTTYDTAGQAMREQIGSIKEDLTSKADKTALAKTDRKLDALWKLNQGISYEFQTDDTEAYQKTVPSGAKMASVKSIGGKTIVWNQLITKQNESEHNYGLDFTWMDNGKIKISGTSTYTDGDTNVYTILNSIEATAGHKYLFKLTGTDSFCIFGYGIGESTAQTQKLIFEPQDSGTENLAIYGIKEKIQSGTVIDDVVCPQIFDLTQMFGSGNEPSAPEEFEAMFPADYYPYNAGELMSAPVNEIVEQGRNLFDCYGFSCTNIPNINAKRDIANDYGTTISTIDSTNRLIVTQNKVDDSVGYSYKNGYFCIGIRGLKCNTKYELAFDFTPTKILIANPVMKMFVNGNPNFGEGSSGVEFSLNVKKHVTIKFTYKMNNDMQFLELRNAGMSGIIENFQIEEGTTVATYSPYHQNTYSIHKAIIDLDGYGWSAGNVRNEVDWENKQYIQRVGKYTIDGSEIIFKENKYWVMTVTDFEKPKPSTKNAICVNFKVTDGYSGKWGSIIFRQGSDGFVFTDIGSKFANENEVKDYFQQNNETIYYELNEEQIIDISDIIDNTFQEPIEVEAGGTLTFRNSHGDDYRTPVPNSEEYVISLAEVAK